MYLTTGPYLSTGDVPPSFDWRPVVFMTAGALLAYFLLGGGKKTRVRYRQTRQLKAPKKLRKVQFGVKAGRGESFHTSRDAAEKEARRFERRGIKTRVRAVRATLSDPVAKYPMRQMMEIDRATRKREE